MRKQRSARIRLWVEELEPRVVLSVWPGIALHQFESIATTSTNWSGYAAETNLNSPQSGAFTAVNGSWTVPAVTGAGTAFSSIWVGLDGFSSSTVEQIGTDSDLVNGIPTYYAWYEMYPSYSINIATLTIRPGDRISGSVNYEGSDQFSLVLSDATTPGSFSTTQTLRNAQRSSAEWIVEAPSSGSGILPLANFGTANFNSASASATLKGTTGTTTGPIDSGSWQNAAINMVGRRSTEVTTSPLTDTAGTSSFSASFTGATTATTTHHHSHSFGQDNVSGSQDDGNQNFMVIPIGTAPPLINFNQTVVPIVPLAAANGYAAPTSPQSLTATSAFLRGSSNDAGTVGVDEPLRNDADVLPDLVPPVRRPQALPSPMNPEMNQREMRPAPTTPMGELSIREDAPPAVFDVREVVRPDTPAETRELRTGSIAKAMISLLGIFGAFTLFGEGKTFRTNDRDGERPDPK